MDRRWLDKKTLSQVINFPCSSCQRRRNTNTRNFWKRIIVHTDPKEATTGRGMDTVWHHTLWHYRKRRDGNGSTQNSQVFANFRSQKFFFWVFASFIKNCHCFILPLPSLILAISSWDVGNSSFLYLSILCYLNLCLHVICMRFKTIE